MNDQELQGLTALLHNMSKVTPLQAPPSGAPATLSSLRLPYTTHTHTEHDDLLAEAVPSLYHYSRELLVPLAFHEHVLRFGRVPSTTPSLSSSSSSSPTILASPASGCGYLFLEMINRCKYHNYILLAAPVEVRPPSADTPLRPHITNNRVAVKVCYGCIYAHS